MRYAIVSDLHANWQAWCAVRNDIAAQRVDAIICLGDVVGYGPSPLRVLSDVRRNCENFVLGNHDAAVAGRLDPSIFNDVARRSTEWTASRLDANSRQFLSSVPIMLEDRDAVFVHAEMVAPEEYGYVETTEDVLACLRATDKRIAFIGHTHRPAIFILRDDGDVVYDAHDQLVMDPGSRYLVNVGSVGDPRDGGDRASYCLFDQEAGRLELRKVAFDCQAYLRELKKHPELDLPWFLRATGGARLRLERDQAMNPTQVSRLQARAPADRKQVQAVTVRRSLRFTLNRPILLACALGFVLALAVTLLVSWYLQVKRNRSAPVSRTVNAVANTRGAVTLSAMGAKFNGTRMRWESFNGLLSVGYWDDPKGVVWWELSPEISGRYEVTLEYALAPVGDGNGFVIMCGSERLEGRLKSTGAWTNFTSVVVGRMNVPTTANDIRIVAGQPFHKSLMNVRNITLHPVKP